MSRVIREAPSHKARYKPLAKIKTKLSAKYLWLNRTMLHLFISLSHKLHVILQSSDLEAQKPSPSQPEVPWLLWQRKRRKTGEAAMGLSVLQLGNDPPHFVWTSPMASPNHQEARQSEGTHGILGEHIFFLSHGRGRAIYTYNT